jgi:hypothetical protein
MVYFIKKSGSVLWVKHYRKCVDLSALGNSDIASHPAKVYCAKSIPQKNAYPFSAFSLSQSSCLDMF